MNESLFSRSGLSLDRLRGFLEFAEAGSIVQAALGDPSRQALISRQIRELEEFFGTELTFRSGKALVPTPAGSRLALLIRGQLQDLSDFQLEQQRQPRAFTIGAGASLLEWLVIPAAVQIRAALGQATLKFCSERSQDLVAQVRDGRIDFAVVREDAVPAKLPRSPIIRVKFHICVPRALISGRPRLRLDDVANLRTLPFAATTGGGQLDRLFRQAMSADNGSFHPVFECDSLLQVRELVEHGACAGLLPSIGLPRLAEHPLLIHEFAPLKNHGRALVLHWNERQMRRRGMTPAHLRNLAKSLRKP